MGGLKVAQRSLVIAVLVILLGVAGCSGGFGGIEGAAEQGDVGGLGTADASVSAQDAAAIAQLAEIAARDARTEGPVGVAECWAPSQNLMSEESGVPSDGDGAFRVLCRVYFDQQGAERYRDMICIGGLGRDPVAEYCYQWAYYADAPKFEDRPAFVAPSSR